MVAIYGRKGEMTQVYDERGRVIPVTTVDVSECVVVAKRTHAKHGYEAVQFGCGRANAKRLNKPQAGYYRKTGVEPTVVLRELRMDSTDGYKAGKPVSADTFTAGDKVDVAGNTKGRGFAGGMKRWGWHSGPKTHGSMSHRRVGSVGAGTSPGRILKGRTMPGQYGNERVTIRKLRIVKVEAEKGLLYISGAIPGHRGSLVLVRKRS